MFLSLHPSSPLQCAGSQSTRLSRDSTSLSTEGQAGQLPAGLHQHPWARGGVHFWGTAGSPRRAHHQPQGPSRGRATLRGCIPGPHNMEEIIKLSNYPVRRVIIHPTTVRKSPTVLRGTSPSWSWKQHHPGPQSPSHLPPRQQDPMTWVSWAMLVGFGIMEERISHDLQVCPSAGS